MQLTFIPSVPLRRPSIRPCCTRTAPTCATTPPLSPQKPLRTPVHWRIPVLGFAFDVFRGITPMNLRARYGPVYKTDVFGIPVVVVSDIDTISHILRDSLTFVSKGSFPPTFGTLLGQNSLFLSDGQSHAARRAVTLPAFSSQLFPLYFNAVSDAAPHFWRRVANQIQNTGPTPLAKVIKDYYFRIILQVTSGDDYTTGANPDPQRQYNTLRDNFIAIAAGLSSLPFSKSRNAALQAKKDLLPTLSALICERLANRVETIEKMRAAGTDGITRVAKSDLRAGTFDMLTMLCASSTLKTGQGVVHDEDDLRELGELVILLWFAGFSTQANSTMSCVFEAVRDREIWRRLREEQDLLVEADGDREITLQQIKKGMPLLDSFITEMLRVYPPVPSFFRKAAQDAMVAGHLIKKGSLVNLDFWGAQRDVKNYPDPNKIVIDRFVPKDKEGTAILPQAIISFGVSGSPHFCIGAALARMLMKGTLASLIRDFEPELDPDQVTTYRPIPEMSPVSGVILTGCESRKIAVELGQN